MLVKKTFTDEALFQEICRSNNWRRTAQRRAVFNCLCGNRTHPTVETVWNAVRESLPDVSLDSIYRILDAFAEAGVICKMESQKVIRYDVETMPHGHYVCKSCHEIYDFPITTKELITPHCRGIGSVDMIEVNVHGECGQCRRDRESRN